ncbi:hypothetical protein LT493_11875 [Streptomyces tricolor]|nr:hypothetical protein [Streptomyces tricolor]
MEGAITPWRPTFTEPERMKARAVAQLEGEDENTPWEELSEELRHEAAARHRHQGPGQEVRQAGRPGQGRGVHRGGALALRAVPQVRRGELRPTGERHAAGPCGACGGGRLNPAQLAVRGRARHRGR